MNKKKFTLANSISPLPLGEGVRRTGEGFTLAEVFLPHSAVSRLDILAQHEKVSLDCHEAKASRNDVTETREATRVQLMDTSLSSYHPTLLPSKKKAAFTLAEVLITLGIIGVVAAITLPALITNIQDRIKEKRVQNIQQKFSKATDKMLATVGLNGYDSTEAFVNELKNHLSIAKICENDELRNCWPTDKVIISDDGKEWEISKTKTGKTLGLKDNDGTDGNAITNWDDTMGIITGDGTAMILSYNKQCDAEQTTTPQWDENKSTSTNCVAAVYDWNGSSKPNKLSNTGDTRADVMLLNAGGLGSACAIEVNGLCLKSPIKIEDEYPNGINCTSSNTSFDKTQYGNFSYGCSYTKDYWMASVVYCGGKDKVASEEDLMKLSDYIYGYSNGTTTASGYSPTISSTAEADARKASLGFPSYFYVWSSSEGDSDSAYYRQFFSLFSYGGTSVRGSVGFTVLCKGD